jgi:DNA-binding transcriptional LysR family regulator
VNPGRIDLNLLRVFDAIYEDRNLLLAGKRLSLSQSAISHALGRLREALDDDLFVRTGKGMEPTARAVTMAAPLRSALSQIHAALGDEPFMPEVARRDFVVAANDYVTMLLMGRLSRRLSELAPQTNLVIRPSTRLDLAGQIDLGRIDIAIGVFAEVPSRFQSMPVWQQTEALVMHKDHPIGDNPVTYDDLLKYPLAAVSLGGQEVCRLASSRLSGHSRDDVGTVAYPRYMARIVVLDRLRVARACTGPLRGRKHVRAPWRPLCSLLRARSPMALSARQQARCKQAARSGLIKVQRAPG